ncbi:C2 family cysteine protease [Lewinella sp. W8]|uniref:C2 family cysteine protease n=1 Tax=Lewinella sp. W8 TaxID=2528208 RepID=UPI0034CD0607
MPAGPTLSEDDVSVSGSGERSLFGKSMGLTGFEKSPQSGDQGEIHFQKHGDEFGAKSKTDYIKKAQDFGRESSDDFIEVIVKNTRIRYDEKRRTIIIAAGKTIRTFYVWDPRFSNDPVGYAIYYTITHNIGIPLRDVDQKIIGKLRAISVDLEAVEEDYIAKRMLEGVDESEIARETLASPLTIEMVKMTLALSGGKRPSKEQRDQEPSEENSTQLKASVSPPIDALSSGAKAPIQMAPGDSLIINEDHVEMLPKKSKNHFGKAGNIFLNKGDYGVEVGGRNDRWVKMKVLTFKESKEGSTERNPFGEMGWIQPDKADIETGVVKPQGEISEAPDKFSALTNPLFGPKGPSSKDVGQGALGSCWLLAPMGVIADTANGKKLITRMITANDSNTQFTVRFYLHSRGSEAIEKYVTVSNLIPTDSTGRPEYADLTKHGGGMWPLVIEKAFAELHGSYTKIEGGDQAEAFFMLTGNSAEVLRTTAEASEEENEYSGEGMLGKIDIALKAGKAVSLGASKINHIERLKFLKIETDAGVSYFAVATRAPATRIGMEIKYTNPGAEEKTVKWSNASKDDLYYSPLEGYGYSINVTVQEGDIGEEFEGEVTYMTTEMNEPEYPNLSTGHAYMVDSVNLEAQELNVRNPHDTSKLEVIPARILEKYNFKIRVGTISEED